MILDEVFNMNKLIYEDKELEGRWEYNKFVTQYGSINKDMIKRYKLKCLFRLLDVEQND
jgi:Ca2+-binding EF-hand superfamily protein